MLFIFKVTTLIRSTNKDFRIQILDFRIQENQELESSRYHFILFMQYKQKSDRKGQVCCFFVPSFLRWNTCWAN